jgi:hypothetical protein
MPGPLFVSIVSVADQPGASRPPWPDWDVPDVPPDDPLLDEGDSCEGDEPWDGVL